MTSTFITGKDASLEHSISTFQQKLTDLGFNIVESSWLNPVPNVWSVHIKDADCPQCFTNGKGATKKAALASALGEYFERLSTNYFFADYYLGKQIAEGDFVHYPSEKWFPIEDEATLPAGILDQQLLSYYDPENQLSPYDLIDLQSNNNERGIVAMPYIRQSDKKTIYIPQSIIANLYVSNGMSAGNTASEAKVQGLSEVFERYVKNKIISEKISLPEIPTQVLARYPHIQASIESLEKSGFPIIAYDASLGGNYPVICVILLNPNNGSCFASFGAHPNFEVALERTVTELLQGRSLKDLDVFMPPSFEDNDVSDHANLETHFIDSSGLISWDLFKEGSDYKFVDWDFSGTTEEELTRLLSIFAKRKQEVYIMDYEHLGVYSCRIIVPSMSDIYPADDLIYANNNMGAHWREKLLSIARFDRSLAEYQEILEALDEEGLDDFTRIREFVGVVPPPQSGWQNWRIGELKSMLYLAVNDHESALDWAQWTLDINHSVFSEARCNYYRCLIQSLTLFIDEERAPNDYLSIFNRMYGSDTVKTVWDIIQGDGNPFYDILADNTELKLFKAHQKLLNAYEKLQSAKAKYF